MCCFEGDPLGNVLRTQDTVTGQYECFSYDARARLEDAWTTNVELFGRINYLRYSCGDQVWDSPYEWRNHPSAIDLPRSDRRG